MSAVRSVGAKRADFDCRSAAPLSTAGAGAGGGVDGACARHAARVAINDADATAMTTLCMNLSRQVASRHMHSRQVHCPAVSQCTPDEPCNIEGSAPRRRIAASHIASERCFENQIRIAPAPAATSLARARRRADPRPSRRSRPPCARRDRARIRASCAPASATPTDRRPASLRAPRDRDPASR